MKSHLRFSKASGSTLRLVERIIASRAYRPGMHTLRAMASVRGRRAKNYWRKGLLYAEC